MLTYYFTFSETLNDELSILFMQWGQFIAHDITQVRSTDKLYIDELLCIILFYNFHYEQQNYVV